MVASEATMASSGMKTEQFTSAIDKYLAYAVAEFPVEAMQYCLMPISLKILAASDAAMSLNVPVPPLRSLR